MANWSDEAVRRLFAAIWNPSSMYGGFVNCAACGRPRADVDCDYPDALFCFSDVHVIDPLCEKTDSAE